jgi:WD40 repeat protein
MDGSVAVWDVARRQKAFDLPGQKKQVTAVAFSPDGALLAAAGFDEIVTFHDLRQREPARTLEAKFQVSGLAFSPDGSRLAVVGYGAGAIPVYEVVTGKRLLALTGHTQSSMAYSPDGRRIATGSEDRTVRLWEAASGQEVLTLKGHTDVVRSVTFSKDGRRLVSGGWDRTVHVWDATPLGD